MKPLPFNGDRTKVKAFIQECNVYLNINEDTYSTNKVKVIFILLLMNKKEALLWKGHFINQITGKDMKITFPMFAEFLEKLEQAFRPTDQAGEAMNKLELLQQGNCPVEEMITDFMLLCCEAELEEKPALYNQHLIKLFANCLNPQLKKRILFGEVVPKTVAGWHEKAIQYDLNYHMGQVLMNLNRGGKKPQKKNWSKEDPNAMDISIGALTEKDKAALMKIGACFRWASSLRLPSQRQDWTQQVQVPKKFTPKDIHGNIRSLTKEEWAKLMALIVRGHPYLVSR